MLRVQIKDNVYDLPNSWDEVSISKYNKITKIENKDDGLYQYYLLSVLINLPIKDLYENLNDKKGMIQLINSIGWIFEEIPLEEPIDKLIIDKKEYNLLKDYPNITFGDWVSIETLIKQSPDETLTHILSILYMNDNKDLFELTKYINNNLMVTNGTKILKSFLEFRNNLYFQYDGYFKMNNNKDKTIEEEIDRRAGLNGDTDLSKWMWMLMCQQMCEQLNYNSDEVFDKKLYEVLNWLSMFKAKQDYENEQRKKNR